MKALTVKISLYPRAKRHESTGLLRPVATVGFHIGSPSRLATADDDCRHGTERRTIDRRFDIDGEEKQINCEKNNGNSRRALACAVFASVYHDTVITSVRNHLSRFLTITMINGDSSLARALYRYFLRYSRGRRRRYAHKFLDPAHLRLGCPLDRLLILAECAVSPRDYARLHSRRDATTVYAR